MDNLSRQDLQEISKVRLEEAKILFDHQKYDGAKYLLGYSVETALKARICRVLNSNYPTHNKLKKTFYTHRYDELLILGGLEKSFDRAKFRNNDLDVNWSIMTRTESTSWNEQLRYKKIGTASKEELVKLFGAITNPQNGILIWIMQKW